MEKTFQSGRWFRSRIVLDGDRIIPHPPHVPYDPFDFYYPYEKSAHAPSIHYQFLDVDTANPQEVVRFCERFGVLGPQATPWNSLVPGGLDTVMEEIGNQSDTMKMLRMIMHVGRPTTGQLCQPLTLEHFRARQSFFRFGIEAIPSLQDPARKVVARGILEALVRYQLLTANPQLKWADQQEKWQFSWTMTSLDSHFTLMLALDLMGPGKVILCEKCNKPRLATNPRMRFCSQRCQNAAKVHAFYLRNKAAKNSPRKGTRDKR